MTKRHHMAALFDESHRSDQFVVLSAKPIDLSQVAKRTVLLMQHRDHALGELARVDPAQALGGRLAEVSFLPEDPATRSTPSSPNRAHLWCRSQPLEHCTTALDIELRMCVICFGCR